MSATESPKLGPVIARCGWVVWEWLARPVRYRAVRRLQAAAESGDRERLSALLAPTVSVVVDRGDGDAPALRVIRGVADAVVVLEHGFARAEGVVVDARSVNSQAGLIINRAGSPIASVAVDFSGRLVSTVWVRLDPVGRRHWNSVYA